MYLPVDARWDPYGPTPVLSISSPAAPLRPAAEARRSYVVLIMEAIIPAGSDEALVARQWSVRVVSKRASRHMALRRVWLVALLVIGLAGSAAAQSSPGPSGEAVYQRRCAACHERPADGRTPSRDTLQGLTATRILRTLDFGAMMTIAYQLNREERQAVARFLGKPVAEAPPPPAAFCRDRSVKLDTTTAPLWNGWSPSRDNSRFAPAALAGLTAQQVPRLTLRWAFGFDGDTSAFSQPTVIGKQVFVGSAGGLVHALRADTGCLQWVFQANGPIRSAIVAAQVDRRHLLLFGDLTGWFYALDAANGHVVWRKRPEEHEAVRLSAPAVVHDGLAYVAVASWEESRSLDPEYPCCTFRGA